jgi:K+-transporting ATPase ATPase A chain
VAFVRTKAATIGNFWVDLTRSIAYILLPLAVAVTMVLASQGVVQNFSAYEAASLSEPVQLADGAVIQRMVIPQGPAASQVAIKQIGTNGGGFFGVNSAHPMENPTPLSNLVELLSILLLPMALCVSFGRAVYAASQGRTLFSDDVPAAVAGLGIIGLSEQAGTSALAQQGAVVMQAADDQAGGNMEGKETRFGIASSAAWAEFTTAASNGSVNSMHDSYTPLSLAGDDGEYAAG